MTKLKIILGVGAVAAVYLARVQIAWKAIEVGLAVVDDRSMVAYNLTIDGGEVQVRDMDRGIIRDCTILNSTGHAISIDDESAFGVGGVS